VAEPDTGDLFSYRSPPRRDLDRPTGLTKHALEPLAVRGFVGRYVTLGYLTAWDALGRRALPLRLDEQGLTLVRLGGTVPWGAVASCRLVQYPTQGTLVVWRLDRRDLNWVATIIDSGLRKSTARWLRENDYTIKIPATHMAVPAHRVVATALAFQKR
ncbi:hypothetical protein ACIBBG_33480, partial [Micromonospora chersina]|uniref:hypothetical protein n=1 Tax=Micromonospora chersina TaxID=47854 RepID=UPI0037907E96